MATASNRPRPTHLGQAPTLGSGQRCDVLPGLRATVLVLEESSAVQELIDQALRELGHRVLSTKDALEALEVVRRVRVDVLVLGALLDTEKTSLVHELRLIQPGMRVIRIAGSEDGAEESEDSTPLSTPLSLDELREAVGTGRARRLRHGAARG
jgi:DNA-binding NtrC family response regulator